MTNISPDSKPQPESSQDDPIEIPLTTGHVALVDPVDADLAEYKWNASVDNGRVYARRGRKPGVRLHRAIFERMLGRKLKSSELVDHIDNNPLNNRRENLRITNRQGNRANSRAQRNNKSGFKGVFRIKNRPQWHSGIHVNNKSVYLGAFATPEEAHAAYCEAAKKYFGEFARAK